MAEGYKDFVASTGLAAADLEDYCEAQGIMRFASASARDTALALIKTEGMFAYLKDVNTITVYSGTTWSTIGPVHGALTTWTPIVVQGATPTLTNTKSVYTRTGRWIQGQCRLALTSGGTASNTISVSGLPACVGNVDVIGAGYIYDLSVTAMYSVVAYFATATAIQFYFVANIQSLANMTMGSGANAMTAALASGDVISFAFAYEAAADA